MFDQHFDQTFENMYNAYADQGDERKTRKSEFLSKEIVKNVIFVCGMIISVKLLHILKIYSDADFE